MNAVRRHPFAALAGALLLLFLVLNAIVIVPETSQAIVVRFGKPERILNRFNANWRVGSPGAGLAYRLPFADSVVWIDKRVQSVEMERQQVLSTDQRRLEVSAFARYRIVDPLRMYVGARSPDRVSQALQPILVSEVRNELGKRSFASLLSPEREGVMENVRAGLDRVARQYGAQVVDVRIKKTDLPDGTPLDSAFERMRTARLQEARSIRAQGSKQAQIIQAEAEAEAARIYAGSFGKDPGFYDFYRAMQSYRSTFIGDAGGKKSAPTTIILSPQNEYLRQFEGRGGGK
ncbi:protease modulator HflC [Sphingomonas ginkgonis]|uniref:Protein HflC n=1 Tax=Sphingomonas ginkgonis TaxID=2315330 RepID=A0A3R9Y4W7_9SPHN|nr:protease modulator HflC [Sphingomonas ginkgonis]RST30233.1 protease modulator HflC [Sphingomonas ginkgonis]